MNALGLVEIELKTESTSDVSGLVDICRKAENEQDEKLQAEISKKMTKTQDPHEGTMWNCTDCGKRMKKKDKLELHVETHIEGFTHACVYCGKIHKTRGALKTHISLSHRDSKLLF